MKYSTKSAQYFKYFEDAKILEMDNENKKLAVVLNGKDDIIDIFDASPYVDYNPFESITKGEQNQNIINSNKSKGVVQIEDQGNNLDINKIFNEIKNYKNNTTSNLNLFNSISNSARELNNEQNILESNNSQKRGTPNFSRMLSMLHKENTDNKKDKEKKIEFKTRYDSLYISKFNIHYTSPSNNSEKIKISYKKPKIQHRLLSVIQLDNDSVLGIKWFSFNNKDNIKIPRNTTIKERYILSSKLLLVVSQEGCVSVFQLINYDPFQITRVNLQLQYLQGQPFLSYKEKYGLAASVKLSNPVLDFNMLYNPLENDNTNIIRLITLHLNNSFTFWYVTKQNEKIELRIEYNYILQDFQCENFLMDNHEEYLICFNKEGILILLSKGQNFPYPKIYRYTFNDVLPPLDQLKKLIYTNDVINDDEEEINEKSNKKNKKEEKAKKEKKNKPRKKKYSDNNIINQEEEKDNEQNKNKRERKKTKKEKEEKEKNIEDNIDINNIKEKEEKPKKNQNKRRNKENKEKDMDEKIKEKKSGQNDMYTNLIKLKIKEYNGEEEEEDEDEEEEEIDEDDDFIVEGNPDFINKDIEIFYDDDKYLKFLQKPFFLSTGTKFLFVNYEVKSNLYSLYCFDFSKLYEVVENKEFLERCLNQYEPNLITKIYSSKEKLYIFESPFYYFNPIKDDSIDNNLLSTINNRKKLSEQKFQFRTILDNSYHGLFIRDGDYILIIKININSDPDIELINNDIKSTKFLFYDQPTSENLKSNRFALWTLNNTLIVNSVDSLFNIIKFRNEANILGIAISKKKLVEYTKICFNN